MLKGPQTHKYIDRHGDELDRGICIVPDHHNDTFTIKMSSMGGLNAEQVKALLQTRFKVDQIEHTERVTVAQNG